MKEIEDYLETYFGIGGKDLTPIGNLFRETRLAKDDYLLKANQKVRSLSFVKTGYLRVFALDINDAKEVTQWISTDGTFITDLSSLIFGTPSRWNIQALSDCELFTISEGDYRQIGEYVQDWQELEKLFIAKCFVTLENRVFNLISMTAKERFNDLMESNPEIFIQVPLQYIASMLGMTPETLSRMRRKAIS